MQIKINTAHAHNIVRFTKSDFVETNDWQSLTNHSRKQAHTHAHTYTFLYKYIKLFAVFRCLLRLNLFLVSIETHYYEDAFLNCQSDSVQ